MTRKRSQSKSAKRKFPYSNDESGHSRVCYAFRTCRQRAAKRLKTDLSKLNSYTQKAELTHQPRISRIAVNWFAGDPSDGKVRIFPHVDGNYATHVYLEGKSCKFCPGVGFQGILVWRHDLNWFLRELTERSQQIYSCASSTEWLDRYFAASQDFQCAVNLPNEVRPILQAVLQEVLPSHLITRGSRGINPNLSHWFCQLEIHDMHKGLLFRAYWNLECGPWNLEYIPIW